MYVELWMKRDVVSISPETSLAEASELFGKHRIRRLPVVREDVLVGIVSPGDIEKVMPSILDSDNSQEGEYLSTTTPISAVMTSSPITVSPDAALLEAVEKMRRNKIDGLPVVESGRLVGIISITNVLDAFLDIMTTEGAGTRLDLKIDHRPESFFKMIKAFQRHNKEILAIIQHHDFSREQQLVSIEIRGKESEDLLNQLWDSGVTVERVTPTF
ncbi:MAG: CBS domain-containing protein [Desulfofustis sp.]|nr:CBS domain-containing protein [Desulfofustis sp.]